MLHWRRKSVLKRHKLWAKLVACSFGMHLVFLLLLFIGYRDTIKFTFSMSGQIMQHKRGAPITLVALQQPSHSIKSSSPTVVKGWINKKPQVKQVTRKSVPKKRVIKKSRTQVTQKKIIQKPVDKKKIVQVKAIPKPKPVQKKIVKNTVQKKQLEQSNQKAVQPVHSNSSRAHLDLSAESLAQVDADFVALQQELERHWQPPVGINQSCACAITAHINRHGKIEDIIINASSGVLMFDVAARTAMLAMKLPKWMWGKSLTITFKP